MAELWIRYPIMQGNNELAHVSPIIQLGGSFTAKVWPNVKKPEAYQQAPLPKDVKLHVRENLTPQRGCAPAVDIIDKLIGFGSTEAMGRRSGIVP
ncbi:Cyclin-dependent kinase 9 [Fasciolopsis buskii]|uniref:Cyclin-dependent kinase 9 n=1 Tax=Fasciolopsis buskii TaxID=27845 RepID=A0A8E0S561_9TREM|nr:Cyclin-dependent kinase 9 [Fasciolopsis buski]